MDGLFLAQPHGQAQHHIHEYAALAPKFVDLSADFRLKDASIYQDWYGEPHSTPEWLNKFVYGLPELQCCAKSLAGGVQVGALLIGSKVRNLTPGVHGSTIGGNPLSCGAALAALAVIEDEDLPGHAAAKGAYLMRSGEPFIRRISVKFVGWD